MFTVVPYIIEGEASMNLMSDAGGAKQWVTTTEATAYLGVSSRTMTKLIREGVIKTHNHPLDRRKKLVRFVDVQRLKNAADRLAA